MFTKGCECILTVCDLKPLSRAAESQLEFVQVNGEQLELVLTLLVVLDLEKAPEPTDASSMFQYPDDD